MNIQQAVGEAIRHFRTGKHGKNKPSYTQEQLTELVRQLSREAEARSAVAPETVSRLENGHANPSMKQIDWLCKALKIPLVDFFAVVESLRK